MRLILPCWRWMHCDIACLSVDASTGRSFRGVDDRRGKAVFASQRLGQEAVAERACHTRELGSSVPCDAAAFDYSVGDTFGQKLRLRQPSTSGCQGAMNWHCGANTRSCYSSSHERSAASTCGSERPRRGSHRMTSLGNGEGNSPGSSSSTRKLETCACCLSQTRMLS